MIKLVAFDWNGTILADSETVCKAANKVLGHYGKKTISLQQYRQTFKVPVGEFYARHGLTKEFCLKHSKELSAKFIGYYEPLAKHCRSRCGSKEVLQWLSKNHISAILFSNHTLAGINYQIARLGLAKYFDKVLAHDTGHHNNMHKRGKGDKLKEYVKIHKFKAKEVLVVGDTDEEIEVGKQLGYYTVGISGGHQITPLIAKHHPDYLIHNMLELKKIVKKLNS